MNLEINGASRQVGEALTLAALIAAELGSGRGSAAVVDGVVVPRSEWPALALREGQRVELITAVQGG